MTNVTHAELIADGGAALVGHKGPLTGEVNQIVAAIIDQESLTLERFGGGPAESAAQNSAAWALLAAELSASDGRARVRFFGGTYEFDETLELPASPPGIEIVGEGLSTIIKQVTADEHVFALPGGVGTTHTLAIRNMQLAGPGWDVGTAYAAHGFYAPSGTPDAFNLLFEDLYISNVSGDCLSLGTACFTLKARRCQFDQFGRHGINGGGNSWSLENCYAHNARKREGQSHSGAGYRFIGGNLAMIGCNGVDSGDYWGVFGANDAMTTAADGYIFEDTTDDYALVTLVGCNVEAFTKVGVYCRAGQVNSLSTSYKGGAASGLKALLLVGNDGPGIGGILDVQYMVTASGSWANSLPIHTIGANRPPFSIVLGGADTAESLTWYDDSNTAAFTMSRERYHYGAYTRWLKSIRDTRLHGLLSFVNSAGTGVDLINAANDGAAATAGVALYQAYRNGSQLMVRMS